MLKGATDYYWEEVNKLILFYLAIILLSLVMPVCVPEIVAPKILAILSF